MLGDLRCITRVSCSQFCGCLFLSLLPLLVFLSVRISIFTYGGMCVGFRDKVVLVMVKAMKNPRSALCKTSIMASSDIFPSFGENLLDFTSDAFSQLVCIPT